MKRGTKSAMTVIIVFTFLYWEPVSFSSGQSEDPPDGNPNFPQFPKDLTLSSIIPHDVDSDFKSKILCTDEHENCGADGQKLAKIECLVEEDKKDEEKCNPDERKLAKVERLFDIFSWQSFLAVNWPVDQDGQIKPSLAALSEKTFLPRWATWRVASSVFQSNGAAPGDWDAPRNSPLPLEADGQCDPKDTATRFLFLVSSSEPLSVLEMEAGRESPVWDQHGQPVYYEALMNVRTFAFIAHPTKPLYNLSKQNEFLARGNNLEFAPGIYWRHRPNKEKTKWTDPEKVGAITLKLAWKILNPTKGDIPDRFFSMKACVPTRLEELKKEPKWIWTPVEVGLVGMHLVHKTISSTPWVWSTFEHVDNVETEREDEQKYAAQGKILKPSFHNPNCKEEDCPTNVPPREKGRGTQITRVRKIPEDTQQLNTQVQQSLVAANSVWQYYELIDTQWPTQPQRESHPDPDRPTRLIQDARPMPKFLANSVMETYSQEKASCMSCHFSASIAGKSHLGDYVRLLERAQ